MMTSMTSTADVAKMDFDALMRAAAVSEPDTVPELRTIPWDEIRGNERNLYTVKDVEQLADSIALHGLLDPVVVMPDADGHWVLVSGHRRHKAWGILREKEPDKYREIPAIVRTFASPAMAELALIMANATARVLTAPEVYEQAKRIERLLYDLKEEGVRFPGRMREQVAKACQVSSSKLARLKVIDERLADCWRDAWTAGKLPEETAYQLAQGSVAMQQRIRNAFPNSAPPTSEGVAKVRKAFAAGNDYSAAGLSAPGCEECSNGINFLRHDLEESWSPCEGKRCCLTCDKATRGWAVCERMCAKAKAARKATVKAEKERENEETKKKQSRAAAELRESAARLAKAADAAGVADDVKIPQGPYSHVTVGWLRKAAAGEDVGSYWANPIDADHLSVASAAKALGCSADYICGLSDDLHPAAGAGEASPSPAPADVSETDTAAPGWRIGEPAGDGRYLAGVQIGGALTEQTVDRRDGAWYLFGEPVQTYGEVKCWYPLPRFKPSQWDLDRMQREEED